LSQPALAPVLQHEWARCVTTTACNIFRFLQLSSVPTNFLGQQDAESFWVKRCDFLPLVLLVQRSEEPPKSDFCLLHFQICPKTSSALRPADPKAGLVDQQTYEKMTTIARRAFLLLEEAWGKHSIILTKLELEFARTHQHTLVVAGTADNYSWHLRPLMSFPERQNVQTTAAMPKELSLCRWLAEQSYGLFDSLVPNKESNGPLVGIIMGSQSDWPTMKQAAILLERFGIPYESKIVSAHRTPSRLYAYARSAKQRGLRVIIAGAGGAAHLPGMTASMTTIPVLGVPIKTSTLNGVDSLLSIVQMPKGIPVGTLAIGEAGAANAALLAASILASDGKFPDISNALDHFRKEQTDSIDEEPPTEKGIAASSIPKGNSIIAHPRTVIPSGSTIGIMGGGQLAKMIAIAAAYLGYRSHIYCPDKMSPAFQVAHEKTIADYKDYNTLAIFSGNVDIITYEFENIPFECIDYLAKWKPVCPSPAVLATSQHRLKEKTFFNSLGVKTANFVGVNSLEELEAALNSIGYPAILKTTEGGYDGKGQVKISPNDSLKHIWSSLKNQSLILEEFIPFEKEISIIVARGVSGETAVFPITENVHRDHILRTSTVPAKISEAVKLQAQSIAEKVATGLDLIGLLCIEMFVVKRSSAMEGEIEEIVLVNELAPRPHNSGHWTIEGCATSQFEQLVRAICGLPLGSTELLDKGVSKVVMTNLIGNEIEEALSALRIPHVHAHIYGKHDARPGRKMGHLTQLHVPARL
jgi:5-(carboxyamino)imidazole ribonucleotide synthase